MKKVIFIVLLLALASLGSALPPPTSLPPIPKTPTKSKTPINPTETPVAPSEGKTPGEGKTASPLAEFGLDSAESIASGLKVSQSCASALLTIVISPEFLKCIPVQAFLPLLPIVTDPNFLKDLKADPAGTFKKDEKAFVQFSTTFCPAPKCSDDGVAGAIKLISDGCQDDLKNNPTIQMLFDAAVFYSPLHDFVCFKSTDTKNEFCWDESLTTVFSLPKSPINITGDPLIDSIAVADCKAVCTDCNKSVVNTFFNFIKNNDLALKILAGAGVDQKAIDGMKLGVAVKCGINFEDGKIPNKT